MIQKSISKDDFSHWFRTFIDEKGFDLEGTEIDFTNDRGTWNLMPLGVIVEFCEALGPQEQYKIKDTIVKIDFMNGDVMHFFKHLANGISLQSNFL